MSSEDKKPLFAVVELFGHARIAGQVMEQTFGGASLVRVEVPAVTVEEVRYDYKAEPSQQRSVVRRVIPAHTRSLGPGSIYAINWCDEATANLAAQSIRDEPLQPYSVRQALESLPADQRQRLLTGRSRDDFIDDEG